MPHVLPKEETKIVMRPRGGLCLARTEANIVMSAVLAAAKVATTEAREDTICTNPTQNIIVVSTPNEARARSYANVRSLHIGGRNYDAHAYCTAPHGTVKGVIRGIAIEDSIEEIQENVVNPTNPLALEAHRIGNTTTVIVLFAGSKVPNYVKYGSMLLRCGLYKQHYDVCKICGKIGHRADVCPTPETKICFACGTPNPTTDHEAQCKPHCRLCNGPHPTGEAGCTNKYKIPFVVTKRRWERRNAAQQESILSTQDFPQLQTQPQLRQQQTQLQRESRRQSRTAGERSNSQHRSKSRGRSASRNRRKEDIGNQKMEGARNPQRQNGVISWARVTDPVTTHRQSPSNGNLSRDATSQELKAENERLMRRIMEQDARIQVLSAKLDQLISINQQQAAQESIKTPAQEQPVTNENKDTSAMDTQTPTTAEDNGTEPEAAETNRVSEPAPKRRALENARERRINARLDSLEERQDRLEQAVRANTEAIRAINERLDAFGQRLDALGQTCQQMMAMIQTLVKAQTPGIIPQQATLQHQQWTE